MAPPGEMPTKGSAPRTRASGRKCANPRDFRDRLIGDSGASYFIKKEKLSLLLPESLVSNHGGSWVCAHCFSAPFCNSAPGSSKALAWLGWGPPEPPPTCSPKGAPNL